MRAYAAILSARFRLLLQYRAAAIAGLCCGSITGRAPALTFNSARMPGGVCSATNRSKPANAFSGRWSDTRRIEIFTLAWEGMIVLAPGPV